MAATLSDLNQIIQDINNLVDRLVTLAQTGGKVDFQPQVTNLGAAADKMRAVIATSTPTP